MIQPSRFVSSLSPYQITPQDVWSGHSPCSLLKSDWNEAPFDFTLYQEELQRIANERGAIAWYPDYLSAELNDQLSIFTGIAASQILTFPGSDVALEALCRAYLEPCDQSLAVCPTYDNFFVYVLQTGAELSQHDLVPPFLVDIDSICLSIDRLGPAKLVYIARPNNPCGYILSCSEVMLIASRFPDALIVIDEAYIEFADDLSCVSLVDRFPNICVTRTFSKAFGMAGLRLGYLCASPDVIDTVNKIRNGKNVSMIAQRLGLYALRNYDHIANWIAEVKGSREKFGRWCLENNIEYYHSHGNFVLFKVSSPNDLCASLRNNGVYIRNRSTMVPGCVRATMGGSLQFTALIGSLNMFPQFL